MPLSFIFSFLSRILVSISSQFQMQENPREKSGETNSLRLEMVPSLVS